MTSRGRPVADKQELRDRALVRRRARPPQERADADTALADVLLRQPPITAARSVAAYVSVGTEPPTDSLLEALRQRGTRVLLPALLPDLDLDWAEYAGRSALVAGPRGMWQPRGPALGTDAVRAVDALLCPGLAVDRTGLRLGRGGGSYDRALARAGDAVWSCVMLYADEVLDDNLPAEPHDQRVRAAATPDGVIRLRR